MSEEIAYALITPHSLYKSRTGGIVSRLLANAKLEFVAARMFVFSDEFLDAYKKVLCPSGMDPAVEKAWQEYVDTNLRQDNPYGLLPRCMGMLFRGPDAVRHLKDEVIGSFTERPVGDTIRGTYGDFIRDAGGTIHYFEPAVITAPNSEQNRVHLKLLADYARSDGGILAGRMTYDEGKPQVTLVMLKPDNFYRRSRRPGNIIDTFSLTGLRIVGAKLFRMTVAQGEEFYGPLKDIFVGKLQFLVSNVVHDRLGDAFGFCFSKEDAEKIAEMFAERNAICEFNKIVEYMTGLNPAGVAEKDKATASNTRCLALLYEGVNAVEKVRAVLGSTDPSKAEPGTVRSDFGRDLMRNGAHASDSPENAMRERRIVGLADDSERDACDFAEIIRDHLAGRGDS
ncbi:MAG: nucleoside-diphosphate kinase [Phycisphaerae bacterium]|nr:nucleoside-diphosphate kinase [Phycisphaerae bacterium]